MYMSHIQNLNTSSCDFFQLGFTSFKYISVPQTDIICKDTVNLNKLYCSDISWQDYSKTGQSDGVDQPADIVRNGNDITGK